MKKLFLSLTATLAGMTNGTVSAEDLKTGIFVFASPRDHVLRTNLAPNEGSKSWTGFERTTHESLLEHLEVADREKRVGWIRPTPAGAAGYPMSKHDDFKLLNEVLHQNRLPRIDTDQRFTFQRVAERLAARNAPVQVVY
jgi:hypothetical protein